MRASSSGRSPNPAFLDSPGRHTPRATSLIFRRPSLGQPRFLRRCRGGLAGRAGIGDTPISTGAGKTLPRLFQVFA